MPPRMDQQPSTIDSVSGNRLEYDPVLRLVVHKGLEYALNREVRQQNRFIYLEMAKAIKMREVKDLASGMREAIANVKKLSIDAKSALESEVTRALTNAEKIKSFTGELSDANKEVESFLGETGSNFSPQTGSTQPLAGHPVPRDINGVALNPEAKK